MLCLFSKEGCVGPSREIGDVGNEYRCLPCVALRRERQDHAEQLTASESRASEAERLCAERGEEIERLRGELEEAWDEITLTPEEYKDIGLHGAINKAIDQLREERDAARRELAAERGRRERAMEAGITLAKECELALSSEIPMATTRLAIGRFKWALAALSDPAAAVPPSAHEVTKDKAP